LALHKTDNILWASLFLLSLLNLVATMTLPKKSNEAIKALHAQKHREWSKHNYEKKKEEKRKKLLELGDRVLSASTFRHTE
jgi:hypothetical protein